MTYNPDDVAQLSLRESKRLHPATRGTDVSRETCERCGHSLSDHEIKATKDTVLGNLLLGAGAARTCLVEDCICFEVRTRSWDVT